MPSAPSPDRIFSVLQFALQSGPLAGAKAAYFHRATIETIEYALVLLIVTERNMKPMGFSLTQANRVAHWRTQALKALEKLDSTAPILRHPSSSATTIPSSSTFSIDQKSDHNSTEQQKNDQTEEIKMN